MNCLVCKHYDRIHRICSFVNVPHFEIGYVKGCWPADCICKGGAGCDVMNFVDKKGKIPKDNKDPSSHCPCMDRNGNAWYCDYGIRKVSHFVGSGGRFKWKPISNCMCNSYELSPAAAVFVLSLDVVCAPISSNEFSSYLWFDKICLGCSNPIKEVLLPIATSIGFKFTKDGYYSYNSNKMMVVDLLAIFYGTKCASEILKKYKNGPKVIQQLNNQLNNIGLRINPEGGVSVIKGYEGYSDSMAEEIKSIVQKRFQKVSKELEQWKN